MVLKILAQLMARHGATVIRSVSQAYRRVTTGAKGGGRQQSPFHQFVDKAVKAVRHKPMTRNEAANILNINVPPQEEEEEVKKAKSEENGENEEDKLDPKLVMERFQKLMRSNNASKGGSFYIQAKIFNAKEFFMKDFPPELNQSEFNPKEGDSTEKPEEPEIPPQLGQQTQEQESPKQEQPESPQKEKKE